MNSGQFSKGVVYGVGTDDTTYQKERRIYCGGSSTVVWYCPTYTAWKNMLRRCYHNPLPSYEGVEVCAEWHYFSKFKWWYESQPHAGEDSINLDKDLLGSGTLYSPEVCCLLPKLINLFLVAERTRDAGLVGAWYDSERNKFQAYCKAYKGQRVHLGRYDTELEANLAWQREKARQLQYCLSDYESSQIVSLRVVTGLANIIRRLKDNAVAQLPCASLKSLKLTQDTGACFGEKMILRQIQ